MDLRVIVFILWSLWWKVDILKDGFFGAEVPWWTNLEPQRRVWPLICSQTWDCKAPCPSPTPLHGMHICQAREILALSTLIPPWGHRYQFWWMSPVTSFLWTLSLKPPELYGCGPTVQSTVGITFWVWSLVSCAAGEAGFCECPTDGHSYQGLSC